MLIIFIMNSNVMKKSKVMYTIIYWYGNAAYPLTLYAKKQLKLFNTYKEAKEYKVKLLQKHFISKAQIISIKETPNFN